MEAVMTTLDEIDEYVEGVLGEEAAAELEERLFTEDGARAAAIYERMVMGVRDLDARGLRHPFGPAAAVERIRAQGTSLHVDELEPGDFTHVVSRGRYASHEIVATRYPLALGEVSALDMEVYLGDQLVKRVEDVPFEPEDEAVFAVCESALALRAAEAGVGRTVVNRWIDRGPKGRRVIAEFNISVLLGD
jgi:hypothetical protein